MRGMRSRLMQAFSGHQVGSRNYSVNSAGPPGCRRQYWRTPCVQSTVATGIALTGGSGREKTRMTNLKWVIIDARTCLYIVSAIILVVGLSSSVLIYCSSVNTQGEVLGYEVGSDGTIYPIMPDDSKAYQRSLQLYGGKFNVVTDKFRRWFIGMWYGKSLSYTVAFISIFASIVFFSVARQLPGGSSDQKERH
jgi:hypothetical protein